MATRATAGKAAPRSGGSSSPRRGKLAPVHAHPTAPASGRFLELQRSVRRVEPYEITADLIVPPPTKRQNDNIIAAQAAFSVAQSQLEEILTPVLVPQLDSEGKPVLDAEDKPVVLEQYREVDPARIERINALIHHASENYNRALFGSVFEAVMEFFNDRPVGEWNAFYQDIQNEFMPVPEGGACPTCGHINDVDQAGKPPASTPS